jgi:hypothetical protein
MPITYPLSVAAAARILGCSRPTASKTATRLALGTRFGDSLQCPLMLNGRDFRRLSAEIKKNSKKSIFMPGNKLWRKRVQKKKQSAKSG